MSVYVNVYRVERAYGGPEEGGWWFDRRVLEKSVGCATREVAETLCERYRQNEVYAPRECPEAYAALGDEETSTYPEGHVPIGWSSDETFDVVVERAPGESATREDPAYC